MRSGYGLVLTLIACRQLLAQRNETTARDEAWHRHTQCAASADGGSSTRAWDGAAASAEPDAAKQALAGQQLQPEIQHSGKPSSPKSSKHVSLLGLGGEKAGSTAGRRRAQLSKPSLIHRPS